MGLSLDAVRLCYDLEVLEWTDLDLEASAILELPVAQTVRWVKAAGHLAARIPIGAGEVELEPDALLEIEGPRGQDPGWTSWEVDSWRHQWLTGLYSAGVVEGRWRLAVDAEGFTSHNLLSNPIGFSIQLGSPWLLQGSWEVHPGERTLVELPLDCARPARRSAVEVSLSGEVGDGRERGVTWLLNGLQGYVPGSSVMPPDIFLPALRGTWGILQIRACNRLWEDQVEVQGGSSMRFDDLFVGETYVVSAHWSGRRRMARRVFVHDGEPVVLEPVRGGVCRVRIVDGETAQPLAATLASIGTYYGRKDASSYVRSWHTFERHASSDAGTLEFPLYGQIPFVPLVPFPPSVDPEVVLTVAGYRPWTSSGPLGVAGVDGVIDLGTLQLERTGHWFAFHSRQRSLWEEDEDIYVCAVRGGQACVVETSQVRRAGSPLLWVDPDEEQNLVALRDILEAADIDAVILDGNFDHSEAFVRDGEGAWQGVPAVDYEVRLLRDDEEEPIASFVVSWAWQGIQAYTTGLRFDQQTRRQTLRFRAPREGVRLLLKSSDDGQVREFSVRPGLTQLRP